MCPLLQISSLFLIVLCASGVFSSPSVDRDAKTWETCRDKCGKFFTATSGAMSDDAQYACIKGCCSTSLRSLSHHGHSEILLDKEEERVEDMKEFKEKFPKTFAWYACIVKNAKTLSNWYSGVTACCKAPPV